MIPFPANEKDIPAPVAPSNIPNSIGVTLGPPITKLKRLETLDSDMWEDIVLELVHFHWRKQYQKVTRCGGSGDMGRDVIAYNDYNSWVNFQCKYYKGSKLSVADVTLEIGKLAYYTFKREFTLPKKYYFVAPAGLSADLLKHIMDSDKLKREVIKRWGKTCEASITKKQKVPLEGKLLKHIESIDFSIFDQLPPLDIISLHGDTPHHAVRFGDPQKQRPNAPIPPATPSSKEFRYTSELFKAFSDKERRAIDHSNLDKFPAYQSEYTSARRNYYFTEGLEKFSRDWLTDKTFSDLLDECHEAISPIIMMDHPNGLERYLKASSQSAVIDFSQHPLHYHIQVKDKKGMCHHLANNGTVKWII